MSSWWQILEISKESDKQTIKKAYAKLLKKYHPEEDPKGYQKLREAYNEALKYSSTSLVSRGREEQLEFQTQTKEHPKGKVQSKEEVQSKEKIQSSDEEPLLHIPNIKWQNEVDMESLQKSNSSAKQEFFIKMERESNVFMEGIWQIYQDLERRDQGEEWQKQLSSSILWDLDTVKVIKDKLFEFLKDHYYLHTHIWELLEERFQWNLASTTLSSSQDPKTQRILRLLQSKDTVPLNEIKIPNYRFVEDIPEELLERYIEEREKGYYLLIGNKIKDAYEVLLESYKCYDKDPELIRLMGECCIRLGDYNLATKYFQKAYHMNPRDADSLAKTAQLLTWVKGNCKEAIVYFNFYKALRGEDEQTVNGLAYCYYHTDNWIKAKEYFEKLLLIRDEPVMHRYLKNINAHLAGKWVFKIRKVFLGRK